MKFLFGNKKNTDKYKFAYSLTESDVEKSVHRELIESRERYRLLAENIADVIWLMDMDLNYLYISPSAEKLFGYTLKEREGMRFEKILTEASQKKIKALFAVKKESLNQKKWDNNPEKIELEAIHKKGHTFWIEINVTFACDENNKPIGLLGATRDISERKHFEAEIQKQEIFYKNILSDINDLISITNNQGIITYLSPNHTKILGYPTEEMMNKSAFTFLHPDDKIVILQLFLKHIFTPNAVASAQYRWKHKNGQYIWLESIGKSILNEKGENIALYNSRVITDRKESELKEKKYHDSQEFLRKTAVEFIDIPIDKIYSYICEKAHHLIGDRGYVFVSEINTEENYLEVKDFKGSNNLEKIIVELLGASPMGKRYPIDESITPLFSADIEILSGGIHEATFKQVSAKHGKTIESLLNIETIYGIGLISKGKLYGVISFYLKKNQTIFDSETIRIFSRQASIALQKNRAEKNAEKYIHELTILNDVSSSLLTINNEKTLFNQLARYLYDLVDDTAVVVTSHNNEKLIVQDYMMDTNQLKSVQELASKIPLTFEYNTQSLDEKTLGELHNNKIIYVENGIEAIISDPNTSPEIIKSIQKSDITTLYIAGIAWGSNINGIVAFLTKEKKDFKNINILETIVKQHSIALQKLRTESALRNSEEKFRVAFSTSPDSININRLSDGLFIEINDGFTSMTGYNLDDVRGNTSIGINLYHNPSDRDKIIKEITEKGYVQNTEVKFKTKNGNLITCLMSANIIFVNNEKCILNITRNIEDRARIQQEFLAAKIKAQESDRLKSAFLANMSHEIRTPMNGIMGFCELLKMRNLDDERKNKYVSIIHNNSRHLLEIINDIIDISKIESGEMKIYEIVVNINDLIREILSSFESHKTLMDKTDLNLIIHTPLKDEDALMSMDITRIKQIMNNLIGNSFKFTQKGSIEFGYRIEGRTIVFFVKDTGIGIPKNKLQTIFERFKQVDDSSTREFGGTGLGLAICKELIELMNGEIFIESEVNKGSSFSFVLPYKKEQNFESNQKASNDTTLEYNWKGKKVLIVEDNLTSYYFLETLLSDTGVEITWVDNGKKAVDLIANNNIFDIILMDIQLPEMNGYEATEAIKKMNPNIRVMAQSANAMQGDESKAINAKCDDYISKPIDVRMFLKKVDKLIR